MAALAAPRRSISGFPRKTTTFSPASLTGSTCMWTGPSRARPAKPWEAGSFGFVRTAIRVNGQVLLTKFHEGIDISPVKRDQAGNPLDLVSSIAAGRVAYVSPVAGRSNYGKYVVVEHPWENSSIYSLYAHLAEITCNPGDPVNAGSVLGRMGYTGAGIDRIRAHCHLEIGMLVSAQYNEWHKKFGGGTNFHGLFNGMNIIGADAARFFVEHKANPELQFSQFIASTPVYFKVAIPSSGTPDFVKRHPWIVRGTAAGGEILGNQLQRHRPARGIHPEPARGRRAGPHLRAPVHRPPPLPHPRTGHRRGQPRRANKFRKTACVLANGGFSYHPVSGRRSPPAILPDHVHPRKNHRSRPHPARGSRAHRRLRQLRPHRQPAVSIRRPADRRRHGKSSARCRPRSPSKRPAKAPAWSFSTGSPSSRMRSARWTRSCGSSRSTASSIPSRTFTGHPQVINGASELLVEIFGDKGKHSRTALGVAALPLDVAVEINLIVEVED